MNKMFCKVLLILVLLLFYVSVFSCVSMLEGLGGTSSYRSEQKFTDDPQADYNEALKEYRAALANYDWAVWSLQMYYNNVRTGKTKKNPLSEMIFIEQLNAAKRRLEIAKETLRVAERRL